MDKYTFITNSCQTVSIYQRMDKQYDNPFIGSYFQSDEQFVRFCTGYHSYIDIQPVFRDPILPVDTLGSIKPMTYPTMFLGDIEISWIYETDKHVCLEKYNRRLERSKKKTPFFVFGDSLTHQYHPGHEHTLLIKNFESINNSLYLHKHMSPEWDDCDHNNRNPGDGFARPTTWIKPEVVTSLLFDFFQNRPVEDNIVFHVYALCFNEERILPHFFDHYRQADRIILYDNESSDTSVDLIKANNSTHITFNTNGTFDDTAHKNIKNHCWGQSIGVADYVIIQDLDEFVHFSLYPYNIKKGLYDLKCRGVDICKLNGYEMSCNDEEFSNIRGHIVDSVHNGYSRINYCKPNLINPNTVEATNYSEGSHDMINQIKEITFDPRVLLLHYKHLGIDWEVEKRLVLKDRLVHPVFGDEYHKEREGMVKFVTEFHTESKNIRDIMFQDQ
jgi:hypothetical protein